MATMGSNKASHKASRYWLNSVVRIQTWQVMGCGVSAFPIVSGRGIGRAAAAQSPKQKSAAQMNHTVIMTAMSIRD